MGMKAFFYFSKLKIEGGMWEMLFTSDNDFVEHVTECSD